MKQFLEGATSIAKTVALCRPGVIAAYPITPQTHIVEELSAIVANGELKAEMVNVESEHSAASCILGAVATGVRAFSSTSSQGLLLMAEVVFNIAGLRLPVVMCCVNRAVSAPINIWNDQQDIMTLRDAGVVLFFAESIQEACDLHIQAFKLAEDPAIMLPVIINIDGFVLSHGYEAVEFPSQEMVDKFLPPYNPPFKLDPQNPLTFGALVGPEWYLETRYAIHKTMLDEVPNKIKQIAEEFTKMFGRTSYGLYEKYKLDDAENIFVSFGSVAGPIKDVVDSLRERNEKVGLLRIITYRPFPQEIGDILLKAKKIIVLEKDISLGATGALYSDVITSLYISAHRNKVSCLPKILGYVCGLGGRDISLEEIEDLYRKEDLVESEFVGLKKENLGSFI
ncbi:MAG: pyruvate ferredoxin oxidoreductase [Elusimicrobiota bacterium]|nr:pyruvate ferredoxin oxidoreductase [Endomicrobiia bacterium]MDW8164963.1 pyruvate ferredoxin oxidoreductase [Elusimicrobiota bacterium]